MPEGRVIALDSDSGGGLIRPLRRQPDTRFTGAGVVQDGSPPVQVSDWVSFMLTDSTPGQARLAVEVRHAPPPAHEDAMRDPAWSVTWANIEQDHDEYRQAVERRYKRGELTIYQRAGLLADAEYERATHLVRIVRMRAGGHSKVPEQGTIYSVKPRGFAFVCTATGEHLFMHASHVVGVPFNGLRPGDTVTYRRTRDPRGKGFIATRVERIKRAPATATTARRPEPEEPTPGRWRVPAGWAADDEDDNTDDWSQAG